LGVYDLPAHVDNARTQHFAAGRRKGYVGTNATFAHEGESRHARVVRGAIDEEIDRVHVLVKAKFTIWKAQEEVRVGGGRYDDNGQFPICILNESGKSAGYGFKASARAADTAWRPLGRCSPGNKKPNGRQKRRHCDALQSNVLEVFPNDAVR
jgi:hypothetical protein